MTKTKDRILTDVAKRFAETHDVDASAVRRLAVKHKSGFEPAAAYIFAMATGTEDASPFLDELRGEVSARPENRNSDSELTIANGRLAMRVRGGLGVNANIETVAAFQGSPIAVAAKAFAALSVEDQSAIVNMFCGECGMPAEYSGGLCVNADCEYGKHNFTPFREV